MVSERVEERGPTPAEQQLRDYELLVIISPEVADEEIGPRVERINQMITEKGGIISSVEQWGKRKLAYPVEHFMEGSYVLIRFRSEPGLCQQLEAGLQISEEILRHLLVRSAVKSAGAGKSKES